jgi:hypothetical protein
MRGTSGSVERHQHLAAWRIEPWLADGLRLLVNQFRDNEELRKIGDDVERIVLDWAADATIAWCAVREARPEVTVRRDRGTPVVEAFAGKAVAIWGCGELGGRIAEYLARAGVRKLAFHDSGIVAPGGQRPRAMRRHSSHLDLLWRSFSGMDGGLSSRALREGDTRSEPSKVRTR